MGIWVLTLAFSSCMTLGKLFHFTVPQFAALKIGMPMRIPAGG